MELKTVDEIVDILLERWEENKVERADCGGDVDLHYARDLVVKENEWLLNRILGIDYSRVDKN